MENLNDIKEGALLQFYGVSEGKVTRVMSVIKDQWGDIVEGRYSVDHMDGCESYHTYRYDGISHHHADHDIIGVDRYKIKDEKA